MHENEFPVFGNTDPHEVYIGPCLTQDTLYIAYRNGFFPWNFYDDIYVMWWCPKERWVISAESLHISHSMKKLLRKNIYHITINTCFTRVMHECAQIVRKHEQGTWITPQFIDLYTHLYTQSHAISVEIWDDAQLIGGFYGVVVGKIFCGESMFSHVKNASKIAFIQAAQYFFARGIVLIDCQIYSAHLQTLGAYAITRDMFLQTILRHRDSFVSIATGRL